jgi:hypothetical protein
MSYKYGKTAHRALRTEHNAAHELMATTDRAKKRAYASGSAADFGDVKRAERAERQQIQRLIQGEKRVRNRKTD